MMKLRSSQTQQISAMEDDVFLLLSEADLSGENDEDDYHKAVTCAIIVVLVVLETVNYGAL